MLAGVAPAERRGPRPPLARSHATRLRACPIATSTTVTYAGSHAARFPARPLSKGLASARQAGRGMTAGMKRRPSRAFHSLVAQGRDVPLADLAGPASYGAAGLFPRPSAGKRRASAEHKRGPRAARDPIYPSALSRPLPLKDAG